MKILEHSGVGTPLTHRLNKTDIKHIYDSVNAGISKAKICEHFGISTSSINRVLNSNRWNRAQKVKWDIANLPKLHKSFHSYRSRKTPVPQKEVGELIKKDYTPAEEVGLSSNLEPIIQVLSSDKDDGRDYAGEFLQIVDDFFAAFKLCEEEAERMKQFLRNYGWKHF